MVPLTSVIAGFNCISFHADACCYCESATKKSPNICQLCLRATSQQIKLKDVLGENCPIQLANFSPGSPRPLREESLRLYVQSRARRRQITSYLIEEVEPSLLQVFEFDQPALDVISEWSSPPSTSNFIAVAWHTPPPKTTTTAKRQRRRRRGMMMTTTTTTTTTTKELLCRIHG